MGWFWQSPPRSPAEGKPAPARAQSETKTPPKPSQAQDDSSMDPEIAKFLAQFQAELNGGKDASAAPAQSPRQTPAPAPAARAGPSSSWFSLRSDPPTSQDPSSSSSSSNASARSGAATSSPHTTTTEASGPEAMAASIDPPPTSCRQAFDLAFHCNGLGGQWNAVYRYGGLRDCSEQWDDFWFCMRVKSYSPELRTAAYRERRREKDLARYGPGMPSSEDVWISRDRKVEPGTEFITPMPTAEQEAGLDSIEWSRADNERRRKIREGLGFVDKGPQAGAV
ncbi:hypothetical protein RB595_004202 [Gaeumannomyces hyphopodioides]